MRYTYGILNSLKFFFTGSTNKKLIGTAKYKGKKFRQKGVCKTFHHTAEGMSISEKQHRKSTDRVWMERTYRWT